MAEHLTPTGKAAIIVPEGIIFQSGTAYKSLRKMLVEDNYLVGVISLPAGVFNPYSGVKTSILWLDKTLAKKTDKILFAKIENDGFDLGAQRRPVKQNDLPAAFRALQEWKGILAGPPHSQAQSSSGLAVRPPHGVAQQSSSVSPVRTGHGLSPQIAPESPVRPRHGVAQQITPESQILQSIFPNISLVEKEKIAENGEFNLSGERYKELKIIDTNFPLVKLNEIADFKNGLWKGKKEPFKTVKIIRNTNFGKHGELCLDDVAEHPVEVNQLESRKLQNGDIILENSGGGPTQPVGRVVYFNIKDDGIYSWSNFTSRIRLNDFNRVLPEYLFYSLNHLYEIGFTENLQKRTSGIRNLDKKAYANLQIPLPPLSVQEEIVAEIESYQKIIDGARQVVENYKPKIDLDSYRDDPEWEMVELGEVCDNFQYGSSKKSLTAGEVVCLRMGNIQNGEIDWSDLKYAPEDEEFEKYLLEPGDVLFNRTNSPVHVGKTGIFRGERKAVFAGYLIRLNYKKNVICGDYLNYCLNTKEAKDFCQRMKTDGINQSNINAKVLATFQIPLPDIETQRQIVAQIEREQELVNASKQLIEIFEQKIKDRIARVWGEEKTGEEPALNVAAEPAHAYSKKQQNQKK
jgi:type I restriction enzyme M protein